MDKDRAFAIGLWVTFHLTGSARSKPVGRCGVLLRSRELANRGEHSAACRFSSFLIETAQLGAKQREIEHVEPAEDPVNDCPQDRMVGRVGDRYRQRRAKAGAVFGSLNTNPVGTSSVHLSLNSNFA